MYVGKIGTGLIQLFLTVTGLGVMFSAIWVLIDFIAIAAGISRDRAGNFVRNWDARI
jgi:TM2 domain-containing membrane protein YozV